MSAANRIIEQLKTAKQSLVMQYHINELALFGSYSRGEEHPDSDIDLLVTFSQPIGVGFIDLADELEKILHKKVDLVSRNAIKPKYFQAIKDQLIYV